MQNKYILDGKFTAGSREHVTGSLVIYVGECSLSVIGKQGAIGRSMLSIAPFHGGMFFGIIDHSQREDVIEKGYELVLSGTTLGVYEDGGGKMESSTFSKSRTSELTELSGLPDWRSTFMRTHGRVRQFVIVHKSGARIFTSPSK